MSTNFLNPNTQAAVIARFQALTPTSPRQWGQMTAGQMLVHCADQLRVSCGEKQITSLRIPGFLKPFVKWFFVTRLQEFKPNMRTIKELDAKAGMTPPTTFEADRQMLFALLDPAGYSSAGVEHPVFGHLSREEFGRVTWKHLEHHLRQFGL